MVGDEEEPFDVGAVPAVLMESFVLSWNDFPNGNSAPNSLMSQYATGARSLIHPDTVTKGGVDRRRR